MSVTLKQFPDEPIVMQTMSPDYQLLVEFPQDHPKLYALLEQLSHPVFWIVDISAVTELSIEDLLKGTELVATGDKPLYRHRNIREVIYVSDRNMIKMAASGLGHNNLGNIKIQVFDNLEIALKYVREQG
jgi:hypothetical protein